jgi:hypothetical protein
VAEIDLVVNFALSDQTQGVEAAGFDTGLLLSPNLPGPELVKFYSSTTAMADDFASTDPEVLYATAYFAQDPHPSLLAVGKRTAPTQRYRVDVYAVANSRAYTLNVSNGTTDLTCTFTSDASATNDEIIEGLVDAWNALGAPANGYTAAVAGDPGAEYMTITADAAGTWISVQVASLALLGIVQDHDAPATPSNDYLTEDLDAIKLESSAWYGIINMFNSTDEIETIADWAEANKKIFAPASNDSSILTTTLAAGDDAAASIVNNGIRRTGVASHSAPVEAMDAAEMSQLLAADPPGSFDIHLKTLATVAVDSPTDSHIVNLKAKRCSFYVRIGGTNNVFGGWTGTSWLDLVHGLDYYHARMAEEIFGNLREQDKTPMDEGGLATVEAAISKVLDEAVEDRFFLAEPKPVVVMPDLDDISDADKAARFLNNVGYTATTSSGIHTVSGLGTVTL